MSLYQIFFSPTGGTKKAADALCAGWDGVWITVDLADYRVDFSQCRFDKGDTVVVAVPSFGGRVPGAAAERLSRMQGGGARAVLLCVYGNRAYDDTLLELQDILTAAGFSCGGAAAAIAEHSIMHQFAAGRPDEADKKELRSFGEKIQSLKEWKTAKVPGNRPYREYGGVPMKPEAGKECAGCGLCGERCPVQAIDPKNPKKTDKEKCISCMRCISICPKGARHISKLMAAAAAQKMKKACSGRRENELFLGGEDIL